MAAAAFATVTALQKERRCEDQQTILKVVVDSFLQLNRF